MKTQETLAIEQALLKSCFAPNNKSLAKMYGCFEVTMGFAIKKIGGRKTEIVDFMAYNKDKEEFRCYEIKVSLSDLKSNCAKSFYGHYNYLVVTKTLYEKASDVIHNYIPDFAGVIVYDEASRCLSTVKKPKKQTPSSDEVNIMKDSLLRTLFYKWSKPLMNKEL